FLIDVRRVNLDALSIALPTHRFGKGHRQGIRLFATRASGAPHANRRGIRLSTKKIRNHVLAEKLPGSSVPKKSRNIDEDRVEEDFELFRMNFQVVDVFRVVAHTYGLHALLNTALQTGRFVAGEVEAAASFQIVDECGESGWRSRRHAARLEVCEVSASQYAPRV